MGTFGYPFIPLYLNNTEMKYLMKSDETHHDNFTKGTTMNLDRYILSRFMQRNPGVDIEVTIEGKTSLLNYNKNKDIYSNGIPQEHGVYVDETKVTIGYEQCGEQITINGELNPETVKMVKDFELLNHATEQVKGIRSAVLAMNEHYNTVEPSGQPTRSKLFVLRDLGFYTEYKYHIIVVPNVVRIGSKDKRAGDPHVIKGYVISSEGHVKYETVQRWRYAEVHDKTNDPIAFSLYQMLDSQWKELLLW